MSAQDLTEEELDVIRKMVNSAVAGRSQSIRTHQAYGRKVSPSSHAHLELLKGILVKLDKPTN